MRKAPLLLLTAIATLGGLPLTPAFAQASGESSAVLVDDSDSGPVDALTDGQSTGGSSDQAAQSDTSGPSPTGSSASAAPTSSTGGQSLSTRLRNSLNVNPVTGIVSASEANYEPLTGKERVKVYFKMNYASMGAYFGPFFTALLLDQTTGSPAQWGGGFAGFGRRVASRVGSAIVQGTVQAPVAALLHEDVRYIASSRHGFKTRTWHAIKYSFLTYNEHGRPTLNFANLGSYYASTAISTAWLPGTRNVAGYTLGNATEQIGLSLPINVIQEFWPEIRHSVLRRP